MQKVGRATLVPAPPLHEHVTLVLDGGREIVGWRSVVAGRSRYWTWSDDAVRPSKFTSAWQKAGVLEVHPSAWRPLLKDRMSVPNDPLAWLEVEEMVRRAILFDGTVNKPFVLNIRSSWDSDSVDEGLALIDQINLEIFAKFIPEPFDVSNYTIVMGWFCGLDKKAIAKRQLSREQKAIAFRAFGWSFDKIGSRFGVSRQRASDIYRSGIDKCRDMAFGDQAKIRRIPAGLWQAPG